MKRKKYFYEQSQEKLAKEIAERPRAPRRYTLEEVRRQLDFVEGLLVLGAMESAIVGQAVRTLGIPKYRAKVLIQRIVARWEDENRLHSGANRNAAVRRTLKQIQNCQGRRDPRNPNVWLEKPNHLAIIRYEEHLAKLQGTYAPIEVDVKVANAEVLMAVFSRYSVDDLKRLRERAAAKKLLASKYLEEHPEERATIDVEGRAVEE